MPTRADLSEARAKLAPAWTPCSNCGAGVQVPAHAVAPDSLLVPMCGPCGRSWRADKAKRPEPRVVIMCECQREDCPDCYPQERP